ncbi:MAG TPA: hypothetical protein PK095_15035, partial [Myxococcota bacterium]|nr:hypothetical protein [Myxococcota bacterium]
MTTHLRPLLCGLSVLWAALSATSCAEQEAEADTSPPEDTDTELPDTDTELPDVDTSVPDIDTSVPEVSPSIFTTGVCLEGWCFEQPLPFGPRVLWPRAFWAASADEAWAVVGSTLVHWKDQRWTVAGGETRFAAQLDGTGPDNVVVGTSDGAMHFDGSTWAPMVDCPEPAAVWVAGPRDVWLAAAERGPDDVGRVTVYRWNGDGCEVFQTFEGAESPLLDGVAADDGWMALRIRPNPPPSDVSGRLLRWDGSTWEAVLDLGTVWELVSVTPDLAWAVRGTKLWQWDGALWSETTEESFSSFWFASETEGWGTAGHGAGSARTGSLMRWDGATWATAHTEPNYPFHLYGAGPDDVLAVQDGGFGFRWDGESWTPTLATPEPLDLVDVAVGPTGEAWAVAENGLMRGVGGVWSLVDPEGGTVVWSGAEGEAWVGGESGLRRWADGGSTVDLPSGVDGEVVAIWGTSPELVFVATPDVPMGERPPMIMETPMG